MQKLAKVIHGSRLYRLNNNESDFDYKSIHLPSMDDCLLLRASKNIQEKDFNENGIKQEYESFALQEFLKLAAQGEDVAVTMLHCQKSDVLTDSYIYGYLRNHRSKFYTKKMRGALGYCKSQSSKYALRADRMASVLKAIEILEKMRDKGVMKLGQAWDDLVDMPHGKKFINETDRNADKRAYEIAGKILPASIAPEYALSFLYTLRDSYGTRVNAAKNMGGQDLKAISHSFRVGYQLKHIYLEGDFSFPLPESQFIIDVKYGKFNYVNDGIDKKLDELIQEVEELSIKSNYPESVDAEWMDKIVLWAYEE